LATWGVDEIFAKELILTGLKFLLWQIIILKVCS
jgi:hypothetical protein